MQLDLSRRGRSPLTTELTPLIDVVFQLLVFFLLTTTFTIPAMPLTLPEAETGQAHQQEQSLTFSITPQGQVFLGESAVPLDKLEHVLKERLELDPTLPVVIRGDIETRYGVFIAVLDACRRAAATKVLLQTTAGASD